MPVGGSGDRLGRAEHDLPRGGPRRGRHAAREHRVALACVERRMQQGVERSCVDRLERLRRRQQPLGHGVDGEPHRGLRRPLGVPGLEHPQVPLLDREFRVLHVLVVKLERAQDLPQLPVGLRHHLGQLADVERRAHAGYDVLPLSVDEEVAGRLRRAGDLVAAEGNAGRRRLALVAEHHLLDVDGRAPVVGDPVDPPVGDRALARPGVEHGADRVRQLLLGVLRELVEPLEPFDQLLQRVDRQLRVGRDALGFLDRRDRVLEPLARDSVGDVPEHLHEPPIGVPREPLVPGRGGEPLDGAIVEPQVEDRVEHPRHRFAGAAADRHQQRVLLVAEPLAGELLQPPQRGGDLILQPIGLLTRARVGDGRLGRDREPGRHALGAEHPGHLRDVRPLAAEEIPHVARPFGEVIDPPLASHL